MDGKRDDRDEIEPVDPEELEEDLAAAGMTFDEAVRYGVECSGSYASVEEALKDNSPDELAAFGVARALGGASLEPEVSVKAPEVKRRSLDEELAASLKVSGLTFDEAYARGVKASGLSEKDALEASFNDKARLAKFGSAVASLSSLLARARAAEGLSSECAQE